MSLIVAQSVLDHWGLGTANVSLIAQRENQVYCVTAANGDRFALRLHRPGYQTMTALRSELDWMHSLQQAGVEVPTPIPAKDGALLIEASGFHIDLLTWLNGRPLGVSGQPLALDDPIGTFKEIGRLMATLHDHADTWRQPMGFQRMSWDCDGLLGNAPLWGCFWENPALSAEHKDLLCSAREKARTALRECPFDYGLIHADMVRENILIGANGLQLIDFDDCGHGYRLFDIATTLLRNMNEPDRDALQSALIDGYVSMRPLDHEMLPLFTMLRALTYVGWIVPRLGEPGSAERQTRFIGMAVDLVRTYLRA